MSDNGPIYRSKVYPLVGGPLDGMAYTATERWGLDGWETPSHCHLGAGLMYTRDGGCFYHDTKDAPAPQQSHEAICSAAKDTTPWLPLTGVGGLGPACLAAVLCFFASASLVSCMG